MKCLAGTVQYGRRDYIIKISFNDTIIKHLAGDGRTVHSADRERVTSSSSVDPAVSAGSNLVYSRK